MPVSTKARTLNTLARKLRVAVQDRDATEAASLLRAMNVVDARFRFDLNSGALCLQVQGTTPVPTGVLHSVDYAERLLDAGTHTVIKLRGAIASPFGDSVPLPTYWDHLMNDGD